MTRLSHSHPRSSSMRSAVLVLLLAGILHADEYDRLDVGEQPDGRIVVPTNQILEPAGTQLVFPGRPVDLSYADDGRTLVVKNRANLVFIDVATLAFKQTLDAPLRNKKQVGFSVVGLA